MTAYIVDSKGELHVLAGCSLLIMDGEDMVHEAELFTTADWSCVDTGAVIVPSEFEEVFDDEGEI